MITKEDVQKLEKMSPEESEAAFRGFQEMVNQLFDQLHEKLKFPWIMEVTTADGALMKYKIHEDGTVETLFEAMGVLIMSPFKIKVTDVLGNRADCSISCKPEVKA